MRGEVDTVRAEFNSGDLSEVRSEDECEKTSAGGDVYEVGVVVAPVPKSDSLTWEDGVGDVQGERDQHKVAIWKQECVVIDEWIVDTVSLCDL